MHEGDLGEMSVKEPHEMMVHEEHDQHAHIGYVASLKKYVANQVAPGNLNVFQENLDSKVNLESTRSPRERRTMLQRMARNQFWQIASALKLLGQELMWSTVGECVDRQHEILREQARKIISREQKKGSLHLNPAFQAPNYLTAVDIHHMAGGYTQDYGDDDVYAGALYDRGVLVFQMKPDVDVNDRMGKFIVKNLKQRFPGWSPQRILEVGCSIGASTVAFADAWPNAEVHAIDVGTAMLRYAHARAVSLGRAIHFSQQNGEETNFPSSYFDLIVSIGTLHETSNKAVHNIFRECHRLLATGGVMMHGEGLQHKDLSLYEEVTFDWDTHFNAEPFIGKLHDLDLWAAIEAAGFQKHLLYEDHVSRGENNAAENRAVEFNQSGKYMLIGAVR